MDKNPNPSPSPNPEPEPEPHPEPDPNPDPAPNPDPGPGLPFPLTTDPDPDPNQDTLWTVARQPTSPYDNTSLFPQQYAKCYDALGAYVQRDATGLDALVAAFSTF